MKIVYCAAFLGVIGLLSGCGGGGGSGSSGGSAGGSSSSSTPALNVALSASSGSAIATEGATTTSQTVTATATGSVSTPVVADLTYDKTVFSSVTATTGATAGTYTVTATTLPNIGGGTYASAITFRLCQETACANVYPGSTVTYTYNLTVKLNDWTTFQRDPAHTGYVHTTLDATKFAKAWVWADPDSKYLDSSVISSGGRAYVASTKGKVYALNESDGSQAWVTTLTTPSTLSQLGEIAIDNGTVYVPGFDIAAFTAFSNPTAIRGLDAATGAEKSNYAGIISDYDGFGSPTLFNGDMYYAAWANNRATLSKFSTTGGAGWTVAGLNSNINTGETPAVDKNYVYYTTGTGLFIYNRGDGSLAGSVLDSPSLSYGTGGAIAPVITPAGHVIYFDRESTAQFNAADPVGKTIMWHSTSTSLIPTQPAVAGNTVYVALMSPSAVFSVAALSDTDGNVQWSWALPAGDSEIIANMVVCDNLLFVSSDQHVYAIDLKTHQTVWTYAAHGRLSISSNYMLYIVPVKYNDTPGVTAIKLR